MQRLIDAIHDVTARVQTEIDSGRRSRQIDADDLVEVLLAIADRLHPPPGDRTAEGVTPSDTNDSWGGPPHGK